MTTHTTRTSLTLLTLLAAIALMATGCFRAEFEVDGADAQKSLEEAALSTEAMALTQESIEISTDFTIGMAVEDAAEELRMFIESQIPCSTVTREGATVTTDYGTLDDDCVYRGKTYAGIHKVTVASTEMATLDVDHEWIDFTNGELMVNGTADVTWDGSVPGAPSRRVVHSATWTHGERTIVASGDRTQTLIDPELGLAGGIEINGSRLWLPDDETLGYELTIAGVQIRGQDPVPQSGTWTLKTPSNDELAMIFRRLDETTIEVTLTGLRKTHVFHVTSTGQITEADS